LWNHFSRNLVNFKFLHNYDLIWLQIIFKSKIIVPNMLRKYITLWVVSWDPCCQCYKKSFQPKYTYLKFNTGQI
jgi:hypothetical protein